MVGIPFPTIGRVNIPNVHKQEILKALSRIHAAKFIHGDARYVNCVVFPKTGEAEASYRWIDFSGCQIYSDNFVKKDFTLLLESFGYEFSSEEDKESLSKFFKRYLEVIKDHNNPARLDDFCEEIFAVL
jgi:tRNA A-37 threonylcarbamoyl transferase component Bud32